MSDDLERDALREIVARAARMAESERAAMTLQILREGLATPSPEKEAPR